MNGKILCVSTHHKLTKELSKFTAMHLTKLIKGFPGSPVAIVAEEVLEAREKSKHQNNKGETR